MCVHSVGPSYDPNATFQVNEQKVLSWQINEDHKEAEKINRQTNAVINLGTEQNS